MDAVDFKNNFQKYTKTLPLPENIKYQVEECLFLQVHTKGIKPSYTLNNTYYKPKNYIKEYDDIIKKRILNRHPNENEIHYNWRLSVYEPIQREIYVKFLNIAMGIICNTNNYTLVSDEKTEIYLKEVGIYNILYDLLPFILENMNAYIAVIESTTYEKSNTEELKPISINISPKDLIMYDGDSVAFYWNNFVVYMNKSVQLIYKEVSKNKLEIVSQFNRDLKDLPFKYIHNSFLAPFMYWSNLLIRNINEDETVSKHYSTPIKQQVLPACNAENCNNGKIYDESSPNDIKVYNCTVCNGSGVMTSNPGEHYTISEDTLYKLNGVMYDTAKFITPDIGIPEYHLKRWQIFYDRTEESLYLKKKINATESGEAKREDKKDFYAYMMSISSTIFETLSWIIKNISLYINYDPIRKEFSYGEIIIYPPKQFDIMSDDDLITSFTEIQNRTDDIQLLSEMQYQVNKRIYINDKIQLKINDVMYLVDSLYGISGQALKNKYLSQTFTLLDKIIHDKGYKILINLANKIGYNDFLLTNINTLIEYVKNECEIIEPKGIYGDR